MQFCWRNIVGNIVNEHNALSFVKRDRQTGTSRQSGRQTTQETLIIDFMLCSRRPEKPNVDFTYCFHRLDKPNVDFALCPQRSKKPNAESLHCFFEGMECQMLTSPLHSQGKSTTQLFCLAASAAYI